jgi:hypothetical protein
MNRALDCATPSNVNLIRNHAPSVKKARLTVSRQYLPECAFTIGTSPTINNRDRRLSSKGVSPKMGR